MPIYDRDDKFLARWLSGDLTEGEREAFEQSDAYKEFQAIAQESTSLAPEPYDKDAGWAKLDELTATKTPTKVRRLFPWRTIAAGIALVVFGAMAWYITGQQQVVAGVGQQASVTLPDGSSV
ncbi:MAG: hypothetical protein AAF840_19015, partial [Bacteroidota bacterium]